jgi:CRP/FNR family cyclic AMP-dependent transcriptional regulator
MPTELRVGLFEAEPDLARPLSAEEREQAGRIRLSARQLDGDLDARRLLEETQAFGMLVYEGMLLHRLRLGEHETLRLIGGGDVLAVPDTDGSALVAESTWTATPNTRVALLDDRLLATAQRWPRLFSALISKSAEQTERIALQLAICQLPRVADRLLAIMWLLSESWGRVTSSGVKLPLTLTHDALGAMIGARRPTVTLAIGELTQRGALVRQDGGWLLLERPRTLKRAAASAEDPALVPQAPTRWSAEARVDAGALLWNHDELLASIDRLRIEHLANRERVNKRLADSRRTREHVAALRAQVRGERVTPRRGPGSPPAPSS